VQLGNSDLQTRPYGPSFWFGTTLIVFGMVVNIVSTRSHIRLVRELNHGFPDTSTERARSKGRRFLCRNWKASISADFKEEDERCLQFAREVLADQTKQIVEHWRAGIIASIPNLARHSGTPDGAHIPDYLAKSNLRFQQWILDTCLRPYDRDCLNYQQEIALRHASAKKNQVDGL
jgi:hypothetical protein